MPEIDRIIPPALQGVYDSWHFAPATIANGLIFCSGIIGTSPGGDTPDFNRQSGLSGAEAATASAESGLEDLQAVRDPEGQFATAFEALRAILRAAGADLCDLVEITTYHLDMARHMEAFVRVKDRYLIAPYPAWTAIGVAELIVPGGLLEIRAVARHPDGQAT
ncbi:RidA family protein [Pseudooceanicola sp.]|uniref:RidA family protein n=1 Tax=Pseudooceanicola sp. TaxID=1914328 RepID=UPI0026120D38|nr:RidA family protein [Pseudooceanicola sp.]MDF1855219.1 RidA family protein [Pseudooceanicola sp.]